MLNAFGEAGLPPASVRESFIGFSHGSDRFRSSFANGYMLPVRPFAGEVRQVLDDTQRLVQRFGTQGEGDARRRGDPRIDAGKDVVKMLEI